MPEAMGGRLLVAKLFAEGGGDMEAALLSGRSTEPALGFSAGTTGVDTDLGCSTAAATGAGFCSVVAAPCTRERACSSDEEALATPEMPLGAGRVYTAQATSY